MSRDYKSLFFFIIRCTYMAASGLVHEDPDHIFVMMDFLFDIKKVGLFILLATKLLLTSQHAVKACLDYN